MKYVITGIGRSGTQFVKELLNELGMRCEWESTFFHDTTRLNLPERVRAAREAGIEAESSWMAVPWVHHPCLQDSEIIHLVRNPLKQMASVLYNFGPGRKVHSSNKPYSDFTLSHFPELRGVKPREARMMHYVVWNMWAEERAAARFRLEDQLPELCRHVGHPVALDHPLLKVKRHHPLRPGRPPNLDWDYFPDCEWKTFCRDMSRRYGYEV